MPASYVERLLWKFFKSQVIDGYRVFVHRNTMLHTLFVILTIIIDSLFPLDTSCIITIASILVFCGIVAYRKPIKTHASIMLFIIISIILFSWIYLGPLVEIRQEYLDIVLLTFLFGWFLFNMAVFIFHMNEFFASTGGLFLLIGSDKKRVFLAPIPHIVSVGIIAYILWKFQHTNIITGIIYPTIALILPLLLIHFILSEKGRIIRASFSIYTLVVAYSIIGYAYTMGLRINLAYWGTIAIISSLFSTQRLAHKATIKEKTTIIPTYFVLSMLGILLIISHILMPTRISETIFHTWWNYSILSLIIAPITFLIYAYASGKIKYYIERDNFTLITLIKEATTILGKIAYDQLKQYIIAKTIGTIFGKK